MFILSCLDNPTPECLFIGAIAGVVACCSNPSMPPKPPVWLSVIVSISLGILSFLLFEALIDKFEGIREFSKITALIITFCLVRFFSGPLSKKVNSIFSKTS